MKKLLNNSIFYFLFIFCLLSGSNLFAQRTCGSDYQQQYQNSDELSRQQMDAINHQTNAYRTSASSLSRDQIITIPVVVHVVYNNSGENLSAVQIQSQIDVLNEDFRLLNSDKSKIPTLFASLAADFQLQFVLASLDPNGNVTSGITRTSTSLTSFDYIGAGKDAVKFNSRGGKDGWPSDRYLNLWCCDITGGVLGYATFPGGAAANDGVVIDYAYFGRGGSAVAPFDKGRTATHEIGHWLNLKHIWGDDRNACSGTDNVDDTPNQAGENYDCPSFPHSSCSNTSDMFMNYMDYTDDACMFMFSNGQKTRMEALFAPGGGRASFNKSCVTDLTVTSATYATNTTKSASSSITINGNQTPSSNVQVNFIAGNLIVVSPGSLLSPSINLKIGSCNSLASTQRILTESDNTIISSENISYLNAYPNPVNNETVIRYKVTHKGLAKLFISDQKGKQVVLLVNKNNHEAGDHEFHFNSNGLQTGIYLYTLITNNHTEVKRLIIND